MTMPTTTPLTRAHDGEVSEEDPDAKPRRRRFSAKYLVARQQHFVASLHLDMAIAGAAFLLGAILSLWSI